MYHPLSREYLYSPTLIKTKFTNGQSEKTGTGSGFWVREANEDTELAIDQFTLVTNRHVVDLSYANPKWQHENFKLEELSVTSFDTDGSKHTMQMRFDAILRDRDDAVDLALLKLKYAKFLFEGDIRTGTYFFPSAIANTDFLSKHVEWGAQISFSSFQPWRDTASDSPIVRTGIVANDPRHPFVSPNIDRRDILLLEAFSFAGSSGCPVFANSRGIMTGQGLSGGDFRESRLIGIIAGHVRNSSTGDTSFADKLHTGLSYCHRSDKLLQLLQEEDSNLAVIW